MGRRAISGGKETQERYGYTQNRTLREEPRVFSSSAHSIQVTFLWSKQELPDVDGREIPIHDVSFAVFSERAYLSVTWQSRDGLVSICFEISGGGN